jgi:formyltetrahydrofolate deformylase
MLASGGTAILRIICPDQAGLVAAVSDFIFRHGGNIIHADQHTDREEGVFLQRVEFELDGVTLPRAKVAERFSPTAARFGMRWSIGFSEQVQRIAILVSRQGHCMYDLLSRHRLGELGGAVALVASNHDLLGPAASAFGVPFHHLPRRAPADEVQEAALAALLEDEQVEVVVLARYMQVLGPAFVARHAGRIINIHHSFLPAFAGRRPYHQAHERGVKIIGASAHYVTDELDGGPIIDQDVVRVSHRDTVEDMIHKGRDLERVVLARAVRLHLEGRVLVYGNKTVVFD